MEVRSVWLRVRDGARAMRVPVACERSREDCKSIAMAAKFGGDIREDKNETDA